MKIAQIALKTRITLCTWLASSLVLAVHSQTPGVPAGAPTATEGAPEFQTGDMANPVSERITARTEINSFLERHHWQEGENRKPDGTWFFIATGSGSINAPRSHARFAESRATAFEKAILNSKSRMAEFIRKTIETRAVASYSEGEALPPPAQAGDVKVLGMMDKLIVLAHKKLDNLLHEKGIDPTSPQSMTAVDKVKMSDAFQKFTRKQSQAYIAGLQAFQTFEVFPDGRSGEIAVVGLVSDKLRAMAAALAGGPTLPSQKPNKPLVEQLPKSGPELLCSFGVRQLVDENGRIALIAYGQSQPISESTRAELAAEEKAQLQAEGSLRGFAGESVATARDCYNAETYKEFENNTSTYESQSAYRERISAVGAAMNISGIQVIKRWTQKHPLTGQTVVGVVVAWSPGSAALAGQLGASDKVKRIPINADQKGQLKGEGAKADENAF